MYKLLLTLLVLPLLTFAQGEGGVLTIGEKTVTYESSTERDGARYYYQGDTLVSSHHTDVWLIYQNDEAVLEAHDTDADGEPDTYLTLDQGGNVTNISGEGAIRFERPTAVSFAELLAQQEGEIMADTPEEDLVGDLSSIDIPGYHNYWLYVFLLLILGGGGYWWYRKRQQ